MNPDDDVELRALAAAYARAVDRRDPAAFVEVFTDDAVLRVFDPSEAPDPVTVRRGHPELAEVTAVIARYARTYHFVGNATYAVDGETATGEVYCTAHHLTVDGDTAADRVMLIRYDDRYRRGGDGRWRIAERRVLVDWTETHPVL